LTVKRKLCIIVSRMVPGDGAGGMVCRRDTRVEET